MFNQRSRQNRKNQIVITLIQTPLGYSVVEGDDLINKASTNTVVPVPKEKPQHAPAKRNRFDYSGQNVVVPIYPYTSSKAVEHYDERYTTLPACASWFSLGSVHDIERKALGEWFRTRKPSSNSVRVLLT